MIEYTSLDIGGRLAGAGFRAKCDVIASTDSGEIIKRYRSDTLLTWLLDEGVGVYIDKKNGVDYVYPYGADAESVTASTLPDALAEVMMRVMAVSR